MDKVVIYRWAELEKYLRDRLEQSHSELRNAEDNIALWRAQGRAQMLAELINLPETLTVLRGA